MSKIYVHTSALHEAASKIGTLGGHTQGTVGQGRNMAHSAAASAGHPDAGNAIHSFWSGYEAAVAQIAARADALAAHLHEAAGAYVATEDGEGHDFAAGATK